MVVSILILLEVILEAHGSIHVSMLTKNVSILILLEVILEEAFHGRMMRML